MKPQAQKLRIIGGKWRGTKVPVVNQPGLRPTGDRIRETLFNWLTADIRDAHCLDAFAGSGILGLEALSRGARAVLAFEPSKQAANALTETTNRLGAADFQLFRESFFSCRFPDTEPFDIVFIDPPFELNLQTKALGYLAENHCLKASSQIYLERPREEADLPLPPGWSVRKSKIAGAVWFGLLEYTR